MGRGASATSGIDISQQYESVNRPTQMPSRPPPMSGRPEMKGPQMSGRPEMKGPQTDIDSILSGLKTRTVDIHPPSNNQGQVQEQSANDYTGVDDSMISISSLKDMQDANMPKRSRRRNNGSRGNTISLDI
jgi:hypothetical protein